MPASRGVNPLATSHTVEHLSSTCLHNWSHDKPIFYFISLSFKKKFGTPQNINKKNVFLILQKKGTRFRLYIVDVTLQDVI